jgi:hypothetical protein
VEGTVLAMNFLKFLMLLALVLWVGGIVFFTVIEATTILGFVNDRVLAGAMISESLHKLHALGMICGVIFLAASLGYSRVVNGEVRAVNGSNLVAAIMMAVTAVSQYAILPAIARLRVPQPSAEQFAEFQRLHNWSAGLEATTLLLGIILLYLTAHRLR